MLTKEEVKEYCFQYMERLLKLQRIKVEGFRMFENADRDCELHIIDESIKLLNNNKIYIQGFKDSEDKYNTVIADNMKKDKVIDLMAVYISNMHDNINSRLFGGPCFESIQQVKQRFYKEVEENEQ